MSSIAKGILLNDILVYSYVAGGGAFTCEGRANGFYREALDCQVYYQCWDSVTYKQRCASGTVFNLSINSCDFPVNVPGC